MKECKSIKEFGEGVKRIYREMEEAGLEAPSFKKEDFMTRAIIKNKVVNQNVPQNVPQNDPQNEIDKVKNLIKNNPNITRENMAIALGKSLKTIQRLLKRKSRYQTYRILKKWSLGYHRRRYPAIVTI